MTTFYDDINDFFENDEDVKNNINEPCLNILHSKIIKDYKERTERMGGAGATDEGEGCFEDKVMSRFNEYLGANAADGTAYDDICSHIIFIYYNSVTELDDYYNDIYRKRKYRL
jgi:hypothetical protein